MVYEGLTPECAAIGEIDLIRRGKGSQIVVIPRSWYHHVRLTKKCAVPKRGEETAGAYSTTDHLAVAILAEIVFRYRPAAQIERDQVVMVGRHFRGDKWQTRVGYFCDLFGASKKQVREALHRLEREHGLITLELRDIRLADGRAVNNVLYIAPVPERVATISQDLGVEPTGSESIDPQDESDVVLLD